MTKLWAGKSGVCCSIPGTDKRLFPPLVSRPALEPTQTFSDIKQLVLEDEHSPPSRLKMSGAILPLPHTL
jgi:hypothetical protein